MSQSFFSRRSLIIVCLITFMLPMVWVGTKGALESNRNDVGDWLPDDFEETAEQRWFQRHFPHEQFVLVSWEGCTLDDQRLKLMAEKLVPPEEPGPVQPLEVAAEPVAAGGEDQPAREIRRFKQVITGQSLLEELQSRYENLTEEEILQRLEGSLIGKDHYKTCLVVTLTDAAKGKELRPTLEEIRRIADEECNIKRDEIHLGGPPVDNVAIDVEGERTLFRLAGLSAIIGLGISMCCFRSIRLTLMVFWIAILSAGVGLAIVYFTGGTCDAVLLSMPSLVYVLAISGAVHIINYYHDAIRENGLDGAPDRGLGHGWFPCSMAAVTTALGLGSLCTSQVIPISKFGFYSACGVLATLVLLFLYLPALLQFFPSRKYAELHGGKHGADLAETVFVRWWRMAGGVIIRNNVRVSLVCLLVMAVLAVPLVVSFAHYRGLLTDDTLAFEPPRIKTSVKLMKLFSSEAPIIGDYAWLEDHVGPLVPMEVIVKIDNEKCKLSFVERMRLAQEVEHAIENAGLDDVGGALSAATFAPDIKPDETGGMGSYLRRMARENVLNKRLEEHREEFRDYLCVDVDRLKTGDPNLQQLRIPPEIARPLKAAGLKTLTAIEEHGDLASLEGLGSGEAAVVAEKIAAWKTARNPSLEQLGITGEWAEALETKNLLDLEAIERRGNLASIKGLGREGAVQTARAIDQWKNAHGDELWRITARVKALTPTDYAVFVDDLKRVVEPVVAAHQANGVRGIEARYTGVVPLVYKTQHELMRGLFNSLAMAFVLIAGVMMIVLKSPQAGLLSMIPNIFPVVIVFGIMGWIGVLVDVGTMMTASVALGVAVDDTMHYLTWFRDGLDQGLDRKGAAIAAYERCATAMTQTTLIGGLGLAAFAFSTFTPTQRFGVMMLALLAAALVGDLVFLPALLTGPLGRIFDRPRKKKRVPDPPAPGEDASGKVAGEDVVSVPIEDPAATKLHVRPDTSHRSHKAS